MAIAASSPASKSKSVKSKSVEPQSVEPQSTLARFFEKIAPHVLYLAWATALIATVGSLYFSEVSGYLPCMLCWYQRIALYPLALTLLASILAKEKAKAWIYSLPLAVIGWVIAFYHNLLYYEVLAASNATCRSGVSCTSEYIEWFGFITIPFLSLAAFTIIIVSLLISRKVSNNHD